MKASIESSIEITKKGDIFCNNLSQFDVNNFLMTFALFAKETDYNYIKMQQGMVQPVNKDIIISFGIEITAYNFYINNLLSSMEFDEVKKFIGDIYNL